MKKGIILALFLCLIMVFTGCEDIDLSGLSDEDLERIADKTIVCDKPYIRHGSGCCLDNNDNSICDDDEKEQDKDLDGDDEEDDKNEEDNDDDLLDDDKEDDEDIEPREFLTKSLSYYPEVFISKDSKGNKVFDGKIVVGSKAPSTDVIAATTIAMDLTAELNNPDFRISTTLDNQLDDDYIKGIFIGRPCENRIVSEIVGSKDCSFMLKENQAFIAFYEDDGNYQLVMYASSPDITRELASALIKNELKGIGIFNFDSKSKTFLKAVSENQEDYKPVLSYEEDEGEIKLLWNEYPNSDLSYYKVVWSEDNKDLMYPEDGYIQVITERDETEFEVPSNKIKEGKNYYRISVILDGFNPDKDENKRINSNVIEIIK